jgi:hypothetical protein
MVVVFLHEYIIMWKWCLFLDVKEENYEELINYALTPCIVLLGAADLRTFLQIFYLWFIC